MRFNSSLFSTPDESALIATIGACVTGLLLPALSVVEDTNAMVIIQAVKGVKIFFKLLVFQSYWNADKNENIMPKTVFQALVNSFINRFEQIRIYH